MNLSKGLIIRTAKIEHYRRHFDRFCAEQLWVKPKEPGRPLLRFLHNPPQVEIERRIQRQVAETGMCRVCILKARQQGISTLSSAHGFHTAALNDNIFNLVIAQDKETAQHIFELTKVFYDQLSDDIKPIIRYSSRQELRFENPDDKTRSRFPGRRSRITFTHGSNIHGGTGQTIHALHISEASKQPNIDTLTQSLFPAVPNAPGTSVIIESTGFPTGDWFKEFCTLSKKGRNGYVFVFVPWFITPEYRTKLLPGEKLKLSPLEKQLAKDYSLTEEQLKFRRVKIEEWGGDLTAEDRFDIEFPADEDSAWKTLETMTFDARAMYELKKGCMAPHRRAEVHPGPAVLTDPRGQLWIWEEPAPGQLYDIGADVGGGNPDGDYSVAQVVTRNKPHRQVARWRGHQEPIDFAHTLFWLGTFYNTAQVAVECDGIGFATNGELQRIGYPYIYIWRQREKAVPRLSSWSGWRTQQDSKKLMVAMLKHQLMHKEYVIRCPITWHEMSNFSTIYLPGGGETWRGAAGCFDDEVMSLAIAIVVAEDESFGTEGVMEVEKAPQASPPIVDPALVDSAGIPGKLAQRDPYKELADELRGVD